LLAIVFFSAAFFPLKILLVKPDHLGDFALTLPVLWEVTERLGREAIRIIADSSNREWAELLPWLPPIEAIAHPRHSKGGGSALAGLRAAWRLRDGAAPYDYGIELTASRHDLWGKLWLLLAGARRRSGLAGKYDFLVQERHSLGTGHQTARMAERFPAEWGITGGADPALFIPPAFRHRHVEGGAVLLAPFAGQPAKEWAAERWMELIGLLRGGGAEVRLIAGPDRREEGRRLAAEAGLAPEAVVAPGSIGETLSHLASARLLIALDTAMAHYGWLTGTPTLQLFAGTADPERWGALGVVRRFYFPVPCAPCRLPRCDQPRHLCMEGITAAEVAAAVKEIG